MIEVYTGSKPARPTVIIVASAGLLVATLGLALFQARARRALAPEVSIPGTPLVVRPPRGWERNPKEPGAFELQVGTDPTGQFPLYRRLHFSYRRYPQFRPADLVDWLSDEMQGEPRPPRPTRVGGWPGIELSRRAQYPIGRAVVQVEQTRRFACLPRGEVVILDYYDFVSLDELTTSEMELLEDVCASMRIVDPTLNVAPADALRRAGLRFPAPADSVLVSPVLDGVAGVHVGGAVGGAPAWSLGVFRTWLASGRTPVDLLADYAANRWFAWDVESAVTQTPRTDGGTIYVLDAPKPGTPDGCVMVVARSPDEAAIIVVEAGRETAAAAKRAALEVAGAMEFEPLDALVDLPELEAAGAKLVADLQRLGAVSRWGRRRRASEYRADTVLGLEIQSLGREPFDGDPELGYVGDSVYLLQGRKLGEEQWSLDGRARDYRQRMAWRLADIVIDLDERRDGDEVTRRVAANNRTAPFRFTPPAAFVPPPAESIVQGWVARGERPAAIVYKSGLGAGAHTALLRRLAPDGEYPRVLVQDDYAPAGEIVAYDEDTAEMEYQVRRSSTLRRVAH